MNTLIDPLKRIARDLVDKKLWPVAALLLASIIAVPLLIGGSSAGEAPAPAALAATAPQAPGAAGLVTVAEDGSGNDSRPGRVRNPIYDPPEPPQPETGSGGASSAGTGATPTAGDSSAGGSTASAGNPSVEAPRQTTPQQPAEPRTASVYYRTMARWYEAGAGKTRPLARLTPLGGLVETPAMYLGVTKSKSAYAVFLLGANATSTGDAKCEEADCRVIGLKAGQSQVVTMQPADGGAARTYHLEVLSVRAITTDAAEAREMRAKVHADGRDVMRGMWQHQPTAEALQPIQYDQDSGLLFKTPTSKKASK